LWIKAVGFCKNRGVAGRNLKILFKYQKMPHIPAALINRCRAMQIADTSRFSRNRQSKNTETDTDKVKYKDNITDTYKVKDTDKDKDMETDRERVTDMRTDIDMDNFQ
jgi:hypothetical protein